MTLSSKNVFRLFAFLSVVAMTSSCSSNSDPDSRHPPAGASDGSKKPVPTYPIPPQNPPTPVIPSTPTATDCYKGSAFICKIERLITEKTNRYRASVGKAPLTHDPKMSFAARDWSVQQARYGEIGHDGFPELRSNVYQKEFGVSRDFWAENVAMSGMAGGGNQQSDAEAESIAEDFASMWWGSSGHRANMLGNHKNLGVGMASDGRGGWYGTQIFE